MSAAGPRLVVGIEVHCQLAVKTKAFCACPVLFGAEPNSLVCPVCLGHPGALPVLNRAALEAALRAGLALGCEPTPHGRTQWDRKNYFYPDLPKGYQITQYALPICERGEVRLSTGTTVRIRRAHLEEDTGKSSHAEDGATLVDFNRCGVPLLEIVTEPLDPTTPEEVEEYVRVLQERLRTAGASEAAMEKGQMRCEPNVSLAGPDGASTGISELKNLNSFAAVRAAVAFEAKRLAGGPWHPRDAALPRATFGWDDAGGRTVLQRTKETAADYRYFPEPDLPVLPAEALAPMIQRAQAMLTEAMARAETRTREGLLEATTAQELGLTPDLARQVLGHGEVREWFLGVLYVLRRQYSDTRSDLAPMLAKWLTGPISGWVHTRGGGWSAIAQSKDSIAQLLVLVSEGQLTGITARQHFFAGDWLGTNETIKDFVKANGIPFLPKSTHYEPLVVTYESPEDVTLTSVRESTLVACKEVISANPDIVAKIRAGKSSAKQALVGQVMKKTRGTADPARVSALLDELLP